MGIARLPMLPEPKPLTLSSRDLKIMQMLADGYNILNIAGHLEMNYDYTKRRLAAIREKTMTDTTPELIAWGFRNGRIH